MKKILLALLVLIVSSKFSVNAQLVNHQKSTDVKKAIMDSVANYQSSAWTNVVLIASAGVACLCTAGFMTYTLITSCDDYNSHPGICTRFNIATTFELALVSGGLLDHLSRNDFKIYQASKKLKTKIDKYFTEQEKEITNQKDTVTLQ